MVLPINEEHLEKRTSINEINLESLTGLSENDVINLSGISEYLHGFKLLPTIVIEGSYPIIKGTVVVESPYVFIDIVFIIDIYKMIIKNIDINCNPRKKGYGSEILRNQVTYSSKFNFKSISCLAAGDPASIKEKNGFVTWGKMGYLMYKQEEINKFKEVLKEESDSYSSLEKIENFSKGNLKKPSYLSSSSLDQLLSKGGEDFWSRKGFSWHGIFSLKPTLKSYKILKNYLKKRTR